jgi:hemolysin activation/secretion protein
LQFGMAALGLALACSPLLAAEPAPSEPFATAPDAQAADSSQAKARFDVWEIRVVGNTTLTGRAIESTVYPFLGPGRTIDDVEAARVALEAAYHAAGYATAFVDIPEQEVNEGIVRLRVSEGHLDRIRTSGTRYFSNRRILEQLPELQAGAVPKLPELQAQLGKVNSATPDLSVTPVLKAGRTPGTVDINLKVVDTLPVHGSLELNDRYTANTSRLRANASISYTNLFQLQHALALQYQSSVEKPAEVRAIIGSYSLPVRSVPGLSLVVYGVDSKSDVAALGTLSVLGTGRIAGARAVYAPREPGDTTHSTSLGVDYKDFLETIRLTDGTSLQTPIHYLNWSLGHSMSYAQPRYQLVLDVTGNFGVRGVINDATEFFGKRFSGAPNYFYAKAGTQYTRQLREHLQLYTRFGLQYSPYALVSNEQLAIGGLDTVRGYTEANQLGDHGINATLELRSDWVAGALHLPVGTAHGFVFLDVGSVTVVNPLPKQIASAELASYGLGLRLLPWHGLSADLEWAVAAKESTNTKRGAQRTHFSLKWAR